MFFSTVTRPKFQLFHGPVSRDNRTKVSPQNSSGSQRFRVSREASRVDRPSSLCTAIVRRVRRGSLDEGDILTPPQNIPTESARALASSREREHPDFCWGLGPYLQADEGSPRETQGARGLCVKCKFWFDSRSSTRRRRPGRGLEVEESRKRRVKTVECEESEE